MRESLINHEPVASLRVEFLNGRCDRSVGVDHEGILLAVGEAGDRRRVNSHRGAGSEAQREEDRKSSASKS